MTSAAYVPIADPSAAAEPARLRPSVVSGSIVGFWSFFVSLGTIRAFVFYPLEDQLHLLRLRLEVGAASICITTALYLVLARFERARLPMRITIAAIVCLAGAGGFAVINAALYHGMPMTPVPVVPADSAIALPSMPNTCQIESWSDLIAEHSITGYFLMAAWAALYLALGYAEEVAGWERRAATLRAAAQTAELRALRFQVNPHFLFNTLNSLSALVMAGALHEAEQVITGLSAFFRASLTGDPTQDVTLADEIALQRLYLDIEARRFPGRLKLVVEVPPALELACVPGMILQPLVENAVRHGVARSTRETLVRIEATAATGRLHLLVEDDAQPLPVTESDPPAGLGVGLRNVAERLAARHGEAASIDAAPRPEGGFAVRLTLPLLPGGC